MICYKRTCKQSANYENQKQLPKDPDTIINNMTKGVCAGKMYKALQVLLGSTCPASLVNNVGTGEHDLEGNDDKDEHAHFRGGGRDHC